MNTQRCKRFPNGIEFVSHRGGTVGTVLSLPVPAGLSQSSSDKSPCSANQSWASASHDGAADEIRTKLARENVLISVVPPSPRPYPPFPPK